MILFVNDRTVCRLSFFKGKGKGEGSAYIVGRSTPPHLNPLPSNRGEAEVLPVEFASHR
jgi:hypothetical protein